MRPSAKADGCSASRRTTASPRCPSTPGRSGWSAPTESPRDETLATLTEILSTAAIGGGSPGDLAVRVAEQAEALDVIEAAYTHHDLTLGTPADSFSVLYRNSYYPGRAWGELARWGVELRFGEGRLRRLSNGYESRVRLLLRPRRFL